MARHKTGAAIQKWRTKNGKKVREWYACITYLEGGKRIQRIQKPKENTKTAARELAKEMLKDLEEQGPTALDAAGMTFAQLADFYQKTYLIEAEYVDGRKVAGLRSKYEFEIRLKILREYFGSRKVKEITNGDLRKFKAVRLKTPVIFGKNTRGTDKPGNVTKEGVQIFV